MCPYAYPHNHKLSGVFAGCHLLCILLGVLDTLLWGPGSFSVDEQGDLFTSSSFSVILSRFYFVFFSPCIFVLCVFLSPPSISLCSCFLFAAYTCSLLSLQHCSLLFFNFSLYRLIFVISFMFLKFFCSGLVCF
ncbi:hypothetical protein Peur_009185 [Populus x canadensis]